MQSVFVVIVVVQFAFDPVVSRIVLLSKSQYSPVTVEISVVVVISVVNNVTVLLLPSTFFLVVVY